MSPTTRDALLIFAATLFVYSLTAAGHLYSPDEEILFRMTESIVEDGDLAIEPLGGFATSRGESGKEYAQYGVGQPLLSAPFYWIGKRLGASRDAGFWRRVYGRTGEESAPGIAARVACSFFNLIVGAAMSAALYLLLFELTRDRKASALATCLYAFGSLAWAHSRPFFTESLAALCMVAAWLAALHAMESRMTLWMLVAGAAAGFAALVRLDSVLLYPGLAMLMLGPMRSAALAYRPSIHPYVSFCIPAVLCGAAILGLNALHFGGPFASGYSDQPEGVSFSTPILAGLHGFLFSPGKGLFFFSPALVLAFCGWNILFGRGRMIAAGVALSILVPLAIQAKWQNWPGGWCWGPRHIFMIHPFMAIPIAYWLAENWTKWRRGAAYALLAVGAAVNLLGVSQDFMRFHERYFRGVDSPPLTILMDPYDQAYWSQYYTLIERDPADPARAPAPVPLTRMPAPIQHSIYLPQSSVWYGYPRMWRETRSIDNLWFRILASSEPAP